ncbi:MAG: hypothetical protein H6954_03170 [Chromatiaceae bacterium]|nr:hypothetical protein [Chromatiaceae bacterium]
MKTRRPCLGFAGPFGIASLTLLNPVCLAGNAANTFGEVTVRPGTSVICASDPCTVYFETPAGSGTHDILQNGTIRAGVASGGTRVALGNYSNQSVVFRVAGTDLPVAHLTVIGGP